jgi:hypothetical protein
MATINILVSIKPRLNDLIKALFIGKEEFLK